MPIASFANPPLVEVSFGVGFEPIRGFSAAHFGKFWGEVREEFSEASDQPPIGAAPTSFTRWPLPRVWLVAPSRGVLVQVQTDRFYYNWRRLGSSDVDSYPRFQNLAPEFERLFRRWQNFLLRAELGEISVLNAELTYVNQIYAGEGWKSLNDLGGIIPAFRDVFGAGAPEERNPTAGGFQSIYETSVGKVQVDGRTAKTATELQRELVNLNISATGDQGQESDLRDWFVQANAHIVKTFLSVTSAEAQQKLLGRKDVGE
jgi:uncharacterized protein (TIGR04255 family)